MQTKFLGQAYTSRSLPLACQTLMNLYFEPETTGESENAGAFFGTPGLLRKTTGAGPMRAMIAANGSLFTVEGANVYIVTTGFAKTLLGTLPQATGRVSVASNGLDVVFAHAAGWHAWTASSSTFAAVTDAPLDSVITYQDGYIIFTQGGEAFGITGLKSLGIDPLDFASAEGSPDGLIAVLSDHRELWLFGDKTTEIWFNTGNADFPFERSGNAFIEHGCAARWSVCKADSTVFWLGQDEQGMGAVYTAAGYAPNKISTYALETAIASYGDVSDAFSYAYQQQGHTFFLLTFPTANKTWAYDMATGGWSERCFLDESGNRDRHRANAYAFFANFPLVGDWETGHVYALDLDTFTDDGQEILRERTWCHIEQENTFLNHDKLELVGEMGVGLTGSPATGVDPQVMLQWSNDAGKTWSNEHWASIGKIGEYLNRCLWRRLGLARRRVYRVRCTEPVKVAWFAMIINGAD